MEITLEMSAYWNERSLIVNGSEVARLVPASVPGLPNRWSVVWRQAKSSPCSWVAARDLAEAIARCGVQPTKKTAAS
jgi:hypothetical protein